MASRNRQMLPGQATALGTKDNQTAAKCCGMRIQMPSHPPRNRLRQTPNAHRLLLRASWNGDPDTDFPGTVSVTCFRLLSAWRLSSYIQKFRLPTIFQPVMAHGGHELLVQSRASCAGRV